MCLFRPKDSKDLPTVTVSAQFLQGLVGILKLLTKNIQWIAIILIMRSVYGQITLVRQKLRLETALNAWA